MLQYLSVYAIMIHERNQGKEAAVMNLKELRQKRGWSQAELARRCGLHPSTISHLEGGRLPLYPGWRRRIAEALGVREEEVGPCKGKQGR